MLLPVALLRTRAACHEQPGRQEGTEPDQSSHTSSLVGPQSASPSLPRERFRCRGLRPSKALREPQTLAREQLLVAPDALIRTTTESDGT